MGRAGQPPVGVHDRVVVTAGGDPQEPERGEATGVQRGLPSVANVLELSS